MNWLLIAAFALTGCTIEVKPIASPRKKPDYTHIFHHHHVKPTASPTPDPSNEVLSKLAPVLREKSED